MPQHSTDTIQHNIIIAVKAGLQLATTGTIGSG